MTGQASYTSWTSSRYATSPIVYSLISLNYIVTGYLVPSSADTISGENVHLSDLVWVLLASLTLFCFDLVYRKRSEQNLGMNLIAWVTAAVVSSVGNAVFIFLAPGIEYPDSLLIQLLAGIVSMLASCFSFTMLVAGVTEGRALMRSLRKAQIELVQTRSSFVEDLNRYAAQLRGPVQALIEKLKNQLEPQLKTSVRTAVVTRTIATFLDRELREVLNNLSARSSVPRVQVNQRQGKGQSLRPLRVVALKDSLSIFGLFSVVSLYFFPSSFFLGGIHGLLTFGLALAIAFAIEYALLRFWGSVSSSWVLIALGHCLILFLSQLAAGLILQPTELPYLTFAMAMGLVAFASSSLQSAIVRRAKLNAELNRLNAGLTASIAELQQRMKYLQRRATGDLHNRVQAQLLRLGIQLSSREYLDEPSISFIRQTLESAAKDSQEPEAAKRDIVQDINEVREFWDGALEVETEIDQAATSALQLDAVLVERVLAVIREGLTNAAKYSSDGRVSLVLEKVGDESIRLVMINRLDERLSSLPRGMGSEILDENATSWTRDTAGDTYTLTASFEIYK